MPEPPSFADFMAKGDGLKDTNVKLQWPTLHRAGGLQIHLLGTSSAPLASIPRHFDTPTGDLNLQSGNDEFKCLGLQLDLKNPFQWQVKHFQELQASPVAIEQHLWYNRDLDD